MNEYNLNQSPIVLGNLTADPSIGYNGEIYYNSTSNTFRAFIGGVWTSLSSASGANTFLSNLTSPTAINQDLLPASAGSNSLGSQALPWLDVSAEEFDLVDGSGHELLQITNASTSINFQVAIQEVDLNLLTLNSSAADSLSSGNVAIRTGNKTAGTGDSGSITFETGTSSGGNQGIVSIIARSLGLPILAADPASPSAGYMYYNSTDHTIHFYNGTAWLSLATGGSAANTALSNLAAVAINTSLLPGADDTINLGSDTFSWAAANIHQLNDATGAASVNVYSRLLVDSAGATQLSWSTSGVEINAASLNMNSNSIINLANPVNPQDAVTKFYTDNAIAGLTWKNAVRLATAAALPSYTWAAGPSGADTLTANANGALSVDSVAVAVNDRILVKDEISPNDPFNGIYVVTATGDVGDPFVLTRALDMQDWAEVVGSVMLSTEGTVNTGSKWVNSNIAGGTFDTDPIVFVPFSVAGTVNGTGVAGQVAVWTGSATLDGQDQITAAQGGTGVDSSALSGIAHVAAGVWTFSAIVAADLGTITDGVTLDQSGAGSTLEIKDNGVSNAKLAQMPTETLKGNNTGSTANAADLTVAEVTAMLGVEAATPSTLVERDSSGNTYQNQMNAVASAGPQERLSTDGTNFLEIQYVDAIDIPDNQSAAAAVDPSLSFAIATYSGYRAEYYVTDASSPTIVRGGFISLFSNSDGSIATLNDISNQTADIGLVFTAVLNGANMELRAATTSSGSDRTMRVKITRFRI